MPNRLASETSPYLLQHANNPVEWYPWGPEALARARDEGKPILLSIGYAACHWCHVMERESFEDPDIAEVMNRNFVNIKVDREERPELDSIYMQAVQAMTGRGGWPMTVFLTPDLKPFYSGTYFPPQDRMGMPGFPRILAALTDAYRERRGDVLQAAEEVNTFLQRNATVGVSKEPLTDDLLRGAFRQIASTFDGVYGGLGGAPKFPQPMTWEFLLRYAHRTGEQGPLAMAQLTLVRMVQGGLYDHLAGGFHRYTVDGNWLVPHFEKMLYDNALLVRLYLHGYQSTGRPSHREVVEETLDYLLRDMRDPRGRLRLVAGRRQRGRGGRLLRVDAGAAAVRAGRGGRRGGGALLRRDRCGQLRGPQRAASLLRAGGRWRRRWASPRKRCRRR